jgi:LCP family protein required for cell wall assembly
MWKRFLLCGVVVIALTAAATAMAALLQVKQFADTVFTPENRLHFGSELTGDPGGPETFLLIGSDKRARSRAAQDRLSPPHSDTLMLVRMDPTQGQTSILSIPRDLKVTMEGPGGPTVQKVNAAYSIGGARLALRTVKRLLHISVNHVVDVNFAGFRAAVTAVGCVYVDVDHRYFNQNTGTIATDYSSINIAPGYQRLCGDQALSYVRFRHTDSDFIRVARQQDFIRQFKAQVGVQGLLDHANQLEHVGGRSIQTDIHGTTATLKILKLIAFSLSRPVRQVPFRATPGPSYVTATPQDISRTVRDFLYGSAQPRAGAPRVAVHRGRRRAGAARTLGLVASTRAARDRAISASVGLPFPIYYPHLVIGAGSQHDVRRYSIRDEQGHRHHAYRVVFSQGLIGDYYGVQGMDWTNPPLLTTPSSKQTIGGRTYELFYDGSHLRWVAWRTPHAVYWVSNTLVESLSQRQMLAIAESAAPAR